MLNHITDASRAAALGLVRTGRLYDLGRVLDERVPAFPGRYFRQTLVTTAHHSNGGGLGANRVNWITEQIAGTQQLGTHLDALCHLQIGGRGYNGWSVSELADSAGVRRLGVETVPQIVTRGWLVDVAPLDPGEVIGVPDIDPAPGDAVHDGDCPLEQTLAELQALNYPFYDGTLTVSKSPNGGGNGNGGSGLVGGG